MVPKLNDTKFNIKTFKIRYEKKLSPLAKTIIQSFKFKLYYYVMEDLLYLLKSNQKEGNQLLQILNSTVIYLQNNLHVNFFDIYIYEININEKQNSNKFISSSSDYFEPLHYLTIKLAYQVKPISKKLESIW
uniref:Uncharacterized protein n=1 Tax=Cerataulina bicornis TaxID=1527800 RepID=A0A089VK73_CERBC|nr:hypothetical protein Ycf88 [Cerataulina daemon]AIR76047.1 hypothetical protein Ycf88 [Cerataulina daemon]